MSARAGTVIGKAAPRSKRERIAESVADDHARLLELVGQGLADIGIEAALTTFHNLVSYGEGFGLPSRYEPVLDVNQRGTALRVEVTERSGEDFFAWGMGRAQTHPANDPAGTVEAIADTLAA
jgi:hypothetical protein